MSIWFWLLFLVTCPFWLPAAVVAAILIAGFIMAGVGMIVGGICICVSVIMDVSRR
jgi:predicted phage tail protein